MPLVALFIAVFVIYNWELILSQIAIYLVWIISYIVYFVCGPEEMRFCGRNLFFWAFDSLPYQ